MNDTVLIPGGAGFTPPGFLQRAPTGHAVGSRLCEYFYKEGGVRE